jgi:hypothetical protein
MLTCVLLREEWTVSGHYVGKNCAEFGIVREMVRLDTEMYEQGWESAHACVVKYTRARLPSQGRRAGLASQTRTCMGTFTRASSVHAELLVCRNRADTNRLEQDEEGVCNGNCTF